MDSVGSGRKIEGTKHTQEPGGTKPSSSSWGFPSFSTFTQGVVGVVSGATRVVVGGTKTLQEYNIEVIPEALEEILKLDNKTGKITATFKTPKDVEKLFEKGKQYLARIITVDLEKYKFPEAEGESEKAEEIEEEEDCLFDDSEGISLKKLFNECPLLNKLIVGPIPATLPKSTIPLTSTIKHLVVKGEYNSHDVFDWSNSPLQILECHSLYVSGNFPLPETRLKWLVLEERPNKNLLENPPKNFLGLEIVNLRESLPFYDAKGIQRVKIGAVFSGATLEISSCNSLEEVHIQEIANKGRVVIKNNSNDLKITIGKIDGGGCLKFETLLNNIHLQFKEQIDPQASIQLYVDYGKWIKTVVHSPENTDNEEAFRELKKRAPGAKWSASS